MIIDEEVSMTTHSLNSDLTYVRDLIGAGWKGAVAARPSVRTQAAFLVAPAVLGAGLGALSAYLRKDRRTITRCASAGLIGTVVGLSAAAAWASRGSARAALRNVNTVRDAHWLEKNPIAYA
jgi:hypothetical protein